MAKLIHTSSIGDAPEFGSREDLDSNPLGGSKTCPMNLHRIWQTISLSSSQKWFKVRGQKCEYWSEATVWSTHFQSVQFYLRTFKTFQQTGTWISQTVAISKHYSSTGKRHQLQYLPIAISYPTPCITNSCLEECRILPKRTCEGLCPAMHSYTW